MPQVRLQSIRSFALAAAALVAIQSLTFPARAAEPTEGERKSAARTLYSEGVKAQDKGDYAKALELFEGAQRNFQAPTHELHIAECHAMLGKLVEAQEDYNGLIRAKLAPNAPAAFTQAQEQARAELTGVAARVPQLKLDVRPAPAKLQNLKITLNDVAIDAAFVGVSKPINPGRYKVVVSADGYQTAHGEVDVKERETVPVAIVLEPGGPAPTTSAPAVPASTTGGTEPPEAVPLPEKREKAALFLGAHLGALVPGGKLTNNLKLQDTVATGGAFGLDVGLRVFRSLYLGAVIEGAAFGTGSSDAKVGVGVLGAGTAEKLEGSSAYVGVTLGAMTASKAVGFYADVGAGSRTLKLKSAILGDPSYTGPEFSGSVGVSIPFGAFVLIPKSTFSAGTFSGNDFTSTSGSIVRNAARSDANSTGELHFFFFVGVTGLFKIDLK